MNGIGGLTVFMIPELNDLFSGWELKQKWLINCFNAIKDDIVVYIEILKMFIDYLKNELDYHERAILFRSANEKYGIWSREYNLPLYLVIDQLWD